MDFKTVSTNGHFLPIVRAFTKVSDFINQQVVAFSFRQVDREKPSGAGMAEAAVVGHVKFGFIINGGLMVAVDYSGQCRMR